MNRDQKIEKINAYRKIIETKRLPKVDEKSDRTPEHDILAEFTLWAESQLASLLGEDRTTEGGLTEDETALLKAFAQRLQKKISAQQTDAPAPQAQAPQSQSQAKKPQNGTALTEEDQEKANMIPLGHRLKKKSTDYMSALDDLDRQAPKY